MGDLLRLTELADKVDKLEKQFNRTEALERRVSALSKLPEQFDKMAHKLELQDSKIQTLELICIETRSDAKSTVQSVNDQKDKIAGISTTQTQIMQSIGDLKEGIGEFNGGIKVAAWVVGLVAGAGLIAQIIEWIK